MTIDEEKLQVTHADLDKRLALVEQKLEIITTNHLAHIQQELDDIKRYFMYGVGVVFVQLLAIIAYLGFGA